MLSLFDVYQLDNEKVCFASTHVWNYVTKAHLFLYKARTREKNSLFLQLFNISKLIGVVLPSFPF